MHVTCTTFPVGICILLTDTYFYSELLTGRALLTGHELLTWHVLLAGRVLLTGHPLITIHIYYQPGMHLHSPDMPVLPTTTTKHEPLTRHVLLTRHVCYSPDMNFSPDTYY